MKDSKDKFVCDKCQKEITDTKEIEKFVSNKTSWCKNCIKLNEEICKIEEMHYLSWL